MFVKVITNIKGAGTDITGKTINIQGKPESEMLKRCLKQAYIRLDLTEIDFDLTQMDTKTNKPKYPNFNKDYTLIDRVSNKGQKPIKILNKYNNTAGKNNLAEYMEAIFNTEMPKYKDYYKVFFFGDAGGRIDKITKIKKLAGHAKDFNSLCAVMYVDKRKATVTHELLHAMGLLHSFDDSADYGYKKETTQNIMDYSITRKNTWLWQWKQLWKNKDLKKE